MKNLKSTKAEGYIVPCVFILIFAMIFAMIFTYSASISKVEMMRENTKVVLDSFVTQNSTEIYNIDDLPKSNVVIYSSQEIEEYLLNNLEE